MPPGPKSGFRAGFRPDSNRLRPSADRIMFNKFSSLESDRNPARKTDFRPGLGSKQPFPSQRERVGASPPTLSRGFLGGKRSLEPPNIDEIPRSLTKLWEDPWDRVADCAVIRTPGGSHRASVGSKSMLREPRPALCYAIALPGRKSGFRAGSQPESNKDSLKSGTRFSKGGLDLRKA